MYGGVIYREIVRTKRFLRLVARLTCVTLSSFTDIGQSVIWRSTSIAKGMAKKHDPDRIALLSVDAVLWRDVGTHRVDSASRQLVNKYCFREVNARRPY